MTLDETMDKENYQRFRGGKSMGHHLLFNIRQAIRRNKLHCGMASCTQLLKVDPSSIMFCILPATSDDLSVRINHTLIKAFCHERSIPVVSVVGEHRLAAAVDRCRKKKMKWNHQDLRYILIQYDSKGLSKCDEELVRFCKYYTDNGLPIPMVDLPA